MEKFAGSNACGWVAAYNALFAIDNKKSPADIIQYIENNNGLILDGVFGTNPAIYDRLFKRFGEISETTYTPTNLDETAKKGRTAILCYFNDKDDISKGAHYININWDGEKYIAYNTNTIEGISHIPSIEEFINKNRVLISLTVIY